MKIGVLVEAEEGLEWDRWRTICAVAEQLGLESVWISDHLQSPWSAARHGLEPWTALAVAAAETRRITLGPLVSPITFREPAIVARMAESLDGLAPGRIVIGLGLGWNADEHAEAGIAFPPAAERSQQLINAIERIRSGLGERRIPILIGGRSVRFTLPIVARYADDWNVTTSAPHEFNRLNEMLKRMCRQVGRDEREIRRSVAAGCLIGRDASELRAEADRMRSLVPPLAEVEDVCEAARQMGWVVGTPEEVQASLSQLAAIGVDRAILGLYDLDRVGALELIAERIVPAVA